MIYKTIIIGIVIFVAFIAIYIEMKRMKEEEQQTDYTKWLESEATRNLPTNKMSRHELFNAYLRHKGLKK